MRFFSVYLSRYAFPGASVEAAEYKYPYRDPYLATATTAILSDDGATPRANSEVVHVPGLPAETNCHTRRTRRREYRAITAKSSGAFDSLFSPASAPMPTLEWARI